MASEKVVATEVAEQEFDRWAEAMDLDFDPAGWDAEDKKSFSDSRGRLVRAIERGTLVVDEQSRMVFTPTCGADLSPLVFDEPTGGALMSMDQKKKGHDIAKLYGIMAEMTGNPVVRFSKMKTRDLKVCQTIVALFLGS